MKQTTLEEISDWLGALGQLQETGKCRSPDFWKPFHFVTLALAAKQWGLARLGLPDEFKSYAARMELWEAAGTEPPYQVNKFSAQGRFLPVQALADSARVDESANRLAEIMAAHCSEKSQSSLRVTLTELLNNCYDHAEPQTALFGLACAQSWPRGKLAQIAIADAGLGIRDTLGQNNALLSRLHRENACALATEYGVTGKPNHHHSGYGLTLARQVLENNGGNLVVISGTESASCRRGQLCAKNDLRSWIGTLVVLEWRTDHPLDVEAVYESWPLPEGMTHEDFLL